MRSNKVANDPNVIFHTIWLQFSNERFTGHSELANALIERFDEGVKIPND